MSINAEVQKSGSESTLSTIRKFSRKVQGTGLVKTVRGGRYHTRAASKTVKKKRALKMLKRREDYRQRVKEGKIIEVPRGPHGRGGYRGPSQGSSSQSQETSGPSRLGESTPIAR